MTDSDVRHESMRVVKSATSLKHLAIDRLRAAILSVRFRPGDRLVERELSETMGISRALLREVLSQLEAEGLVKTIPHKGPIVATYSREEALEIYELRALLEQEMGRFFVLRADAVEREALNEAMRDIRKAFSSRDQTQWLTAKTRFYDVLLAGARSAILAEMLRLIHGRVSMLRATTMAQAGRLAQSLKELQAIVSAINSKDAEAAALACRRHVESAARVAASALEDELKS